MKLTQKLLFLLPPLAAGVVAVDTAPPPLPLPLTATSTSGARLFLRVEGITGASLDPDHRGEIEIDSYSLDVDYPPSGSSSGGGSTGRATFGDLRVCGMMLRAFPQLAAHCASGALIPQVELMIERPDPSRPGRFYTEARFTLSNVIVSSLSLAADLQPQLATEVDLNYAAIEWEYAPGGSGRLHGGWNLVTNTPL